MEKKVGKVLTVFLWLYSYSLYGSDSAIILRMQDMNHEPIEQAMVDVPFVLQVELRNFEDFQESHLTQHIGGIENFKSSRSMITRNQTDINGVRVSKACVNFVLKTDKTGNFTLGPLSLKDKTGKVIRSNRLIVSVGKEQIAKSDKKRPKYYMTTEFDKKDVYVGEKVTLKISFIDRIYVDDLQFRMPDLPYFFMVPQQKKLISSMQMIDDEECSVVKLDLEIYPTQAGSLLCKDVTATFSAPEFKQKSSYQGVFDFFRALYKSEQQIVAPPIKLNVIPLPKKNGFEDILAVGDFIALKMNVSALEVEVGQGIVATIDIIGSGNFEMFSFPELVLPENFKYYDSNSVMIDSKRSCKRYEFVMQSDKEGDFVIPAQRFDFFNPEKKEYESLFTQPISIKVNPSTQDVKQESDHEEENDGIVCTEKTLDDFTVITPQEIRPLEHERQIPIRFYFFMLYALILAILGSMISWGKIIEYVLQYKIIRFYIVSWQAWYACKRAYKKNNLEAIYPIFIKFFAQLQQVPCRLVDDVFIVNCLKSKNFSLKEIGAWKEFYTQMLHISFAHQSIQNKQMFNKQALQWIITLRNRL